MLIRCLEDHQMASDSAMKFEGGKVYNVDDELGRRLLQDFGKGSRNEARHLGVKFARVSVEGDQVDTVVDGETVKHTVTADEAYSGDVSYLDGICHHKVGDGECVLAEGHKGGHRLTLPEPENPVAVSAGAGHQSQAPVAEPPASETNQGPSEGAHTHEGTTPQVSPSNDD